ncbi:hypothetical protein Acr_21g0001690 [Actinidia rufa]|uniref:Uncharacterized protein n=1 Tax=Actinidia rufa TaxID=165716 RepID=A0A7J0GFI1_9ERIC|nr:hypothetical protein Acr_21g0001690 [Actinidia rufa]
MSYQLHQKPRQSQLRSGQEQPSHSQACRNVGNAELREQAAQQQGGPQNGTVRDDVFFKVMGEDRQGRVRTYGLGPAPSDLMGVTPSRAEAVRIVSEANAEVCDMKERMVAMEQTCAQMAAQMTTMMSMMANMQKLPAEHGSPSEGLCARQDVDVSTNSGVSPELQVHPSSSVQGAPLHQRRATNRGKTQNTCTRKITTQSKLFACILEFAVLKRHYRHFKRETRAGLSVFQAEGIDSSSHADDILECPIGS